MIVREIFAKTILSKSAIQDYALNAYVGCQHNCRYCYARFMKRFTGHAEPWGAFVDVKVNAPELLAREVLRKKKGRVWVSGVCDAYQALERSTGSPGAASRSSSNTAGRSRSRRNPRSCCAISTS